MTSFSRNIPLAPYTTFHLGGNAEYFLEARTKEEVVRGVSEADAASLPVTILGGGSNVLISDQGIKGAVIRVATTGVATKQEGDTVLLTAAAGEVFDEVVARAVADGYWGLENLSAIPGSVGATPIQNVGAYGVEVSSLVVAVEAYNTVTGEERRFSAAECAFGYRHSFFKTPAGRDWIVLSVTFQLSTTPARRLGYADLAARFPEGSEPSGREIRDAVIAVRAAKFPDWRQEGTAGSFFKNPIITPEHYKTLEARYPGLPGYPAEGGVKVALGWVLDKVCGLRGYREGAVRCFEGQALVVVATQGASASEVAAFASFVASRVEDATGIAVEWEVTALA